MATMSPAPPAAFTSRGDRWQARASCLTFPHAAGAMDKIQASTDRSVGRCHGLVNRTNENILYKRPMSRAFSAATILMGSNRAFTSLPAQTNRRRQPSRPWEFCSSALHSSGCCGGRLLARDKTPGGWRPPRNAQRRNQRHPGSEASHPTEDFEKPLCKAPVPSDDNRGTLTLNDCQQRSVRGCPPGAKLLSHDDRFDCRFRQKPPRTNETQW